MNLIAQNGIQISLLGLISNFKKAQTTEPQEESFLQSRLIRTTEYWGHKRLFYCEIKTTI